MGLLASGTGGGGGGGGEFATLPQASVDCTYSLPTGGTTHSPVDQAALTSVLAVVSLGDVIELAAGTDYGSHTWPDLGAGSDWVYIVSDQLSALPSPGTRVTTADVGNMPTLSTPSPSTIPINVENGAHHFRFVGINVTTDASVEAFNLFLAGHSAAVTANVPADIIIDRCLFEGDPNVDTRRGAWFNVIRGGIVDSYFHNFKDDGADSQAVLITNTPGPIKIHNNFLEGCGENVLIGGVDPAITSCVPADITITDNHFFKRLAWRTSNFVCKNILEFKNAERCLAEGNTFENNWGDAQVGASLLITPRNQDNTAPWSRTQDITVQHNRWINLGAWLSMAGDDGINGPLLYTTNRIYLYNNLVEVTDLTGDAAATGRTFQVIDGPVDDFMVEHNTGFIINAGTLAFINLSPVGNNCIWRDNIFDRGDFGFIGNAVGEGEICFDTYFSTDSQYHHNVQIEGTSAVWSAPHSSNNFAANVSAVEFENYSAELYFLSSASPYLSTAHDGANPGVIWSELVSRNLVSAGP